MECCLFKMGLMCFCETLSSAAGERGPGGQNQPTFEEDESECDDGGDGGEGSDGIDDGEYVMVVM